MPVIVMLQAQPSGKHVSTYIRVKIAATCAYDMS